MSDTISYTRGPMHYDAETEIFAERTQTNLGYVPLFLSQTSCDIFKLRENVFEAKNNFHIKFVVFRSKI